MQELIQHEALIRPSNLYRRERCPASARMEQGRLDEYSEAAERGTRLHNWAAEGIKNPAKKQQLLLDAGDDAFCLSDFWKEAEACWNNLTPQQRKRAKVFVEEKIDLSYIGLEQGTIDFGIDISGTETESSMLIIRDWKSGYGWVPPAKHNLQLLAYGCGFSKGLHEQISIGIVQPMTKLYSDIAVFSRDELEEVKVRIGRIIKNCTDENPMVVSGPWCDFCRAGSNCEKKAIVAAEVRTIVDPVKVLMTMTGEARRDTYERILATIKIYTEVVDKIKDGIRAGQTEIPGYGLIRGRGRTSRYWGPDSQTVIDTLYPIARQKGLEMGSIAEPISPSKMEKLLGREALSGMIVENCGDPIVKRVKTK